MVKSTEEKSICHPEGQEVVHLDTISTQLQLSERNSTWGTLERVPRQ